MRGCHEQVLQPLLKIDREHVSQLLHAAASCPNGITAQLLRTGGKPDVVDDKQRTALWLAASHGNKVAADALLAAGANPRGHGALIGVLVERVDEIDQPTAAGNTALMLASRRGVDEVVRLLLSRGAKPNLRNANGNTALMLAVSGRHLSAARLLIEHGADKNLRNKKRERASEIAAAADFPELVALLR